MNDYLAPEDCALCPRLAESRRAVVNGSGPLPSRVLVITQNPGREEEIAGEPLVGWSGQKLDYLAGLAGLAPGTYRKENVARCRPPRGPKGDLPLRPDEIRNCAPFLKASIATCNPAVIVTLGAPALRWFLPNAGLASAHGRPHTWPQPETNDTITIVPMYHPAAAHPSRNPGLAPVLIEDWTRLGTILAGTEQSALGAYTQATPNEAVALFRSVQSWLAFDFETPDPRWRRTFQAVRVKPIGVSLCVDAGRAVYVPGEDISWLAPVLEDPAVPKLAHNALFEYIVARNCGVHPKNLHCTKLMAYVLRTSSTHLKRLSWQELGVEQTRYEDVDWTDLDQVVQYGSADSDLALRLGIGFQARLTESGLWRLYEMERAALPVLGDMTVRGMAFDPEPLVRLGGVLVARRTEVLDTLREYFHITSDINLNSDHQLRQLLYGSSRPKPKRVRELRGRLRHDYPCSGQWCLGVACAAGVRTGAQTVLAWPPPGLGWRVKTRTPTGRPAVDINTLRLYRPEPVVGDLVLLKSINQALENNITRLPQLVQEDGYIHPVFHQAGAWEERAGEAKEAPRTGRLSSSGPNLQNVTHHGDSDRPYVAEWAVEIRRAFVPRPGQVLFRADIGQEEPRIGAFLAEDKELLEELETGDVYCPVASLEFARYITRADVEERQIGKRGWMAWLNGAGPEGIQESAFWLSRQAAMLVVKYLRGRYPKVEAYRAGLVARLHEQGWTETHFGRRIYRPEVWSGPGPALAHAERSVMPDAIQGTAADVMKLWLPRIVSLLPPSAHLLLSVHDEVVGECLPEKVEEVKLALTEALGGILPIRLPCEFYTGPNWADMKRV